MMKKTEIPVADSVDGGSVMVIVVAVVVVVCVVC